MEARIEEDALGKVAWEGDGQGILFQAVKLPLSFHIWQLALPSRALRRLTPGLTHYGRASVSLSNDGRSLLGRPLAGEWKRDEHHVADERGRGAFSVAAHAVREAVDLFRIVSVARVGAAVIRGC